MSQAQVRLASPDEAALVHRLMMRAFEEHAGYEHPSSALRETVEDVRAALSEGGGLVALLEGVPVGSGRFSVRWRGTPPTDAIARATEGQNVEGGGGTLTFDRLGVVPEHRGRGIGSAMVDWLEALARRLGLDAVETTARSQQPDNRPWYLQRGYRVTGYSGRYGIPDIRTHMRKDLT